MQHFLRRNALLHAVDIDRPTAFVTPKGLSYRDRAYAAGKAFLEAVDAILPSIAARSQESERDGRV
ncbi:MAG: hypothetical protein CFE32_24760, partial [Alphaproteobacteria bacterium PA3]